MARRITEHQMDRRRRIAEAQAALTDAMMPFGDDADHAEGLTPMEWLQVFATLQDRMIVHGLREEWEAMESFGD